MIEISANTAIMLYLCATLVFLLGLWGAHHYMRRKKAVLQPADRLVFCEYCHCAYLSPCERTVSQCPQCASFNEKLI